MRRRGLLLLGGAAAATLGAALWLAPREAPPPPAGRPAFPGLLDRLGTAARVEVTRPGHQVTLRRDGATWRIAERAGWPARPARLRETFTALAELRLLEPRAPDPRNGTGEEGTRLRVLDAQGAALADLTLGVRRGATQHLRLAGEAGAWLAEGGVAAEPDPNLWLLRELADLPAARLRRVEVRRAGEPALAIQRPGVVDAPLVIIAPRDPPRPDGVALEELGRAFEALTLAEVRRADAIPGEALGESRFLFTDGLAIRAWARRAGDELWLELRAEGDAEAAALNALWAGWGFAFPAWRERQFIPRLEDLLEP
ncbi:hypothetical protein ACI6QG_01320 [Roseococcus sp. DSY-14]|uniref:hypothetical protein n=1 Tax=Roseococcus sp. DSY-14 TaxID=3369650 RepID=UPI00387B4465